MPLSLKIIFVLFLMSIIYTIFSFRNIFSLSSYFFGFEFLGVQAFFVELVFTVILLGVFLFGLWNRKKWTFYYGVFYLVIMLLGGIASFARIIFFNLPSEFVELSWKEVLVFSIVGTMPFLSFYLIILFLLIWNRKYFIR